MLPIVAEPPPSKPRRPWTDFSPERMLAVTMIAAILGGVVAGLGKQLLRAWLSDAGDFWASFLFGGLVTICLFAVPLLRLAGKERWLLRRDRPQNENQPPS